jgi:hypothetical protein
VGLQQLFLFVAKDGQSALYLGGDLAADLAVGGDLLRDQPSEPAKWRCTAT